LHRFESVIPRFSLGDGVTSKNITTAEKAYQHLKSIGLLDVEEFWVLALGPSKNALKTEMMFRGTVDACMVHPRDIFRFACRNNASSLIIAHNHPSGDPQPSVCDLELTTKLIQASELIEIPLLDHLIVTQNNFTSLAREGFCRFS
jgi:DNA repair protein RadC